MFIEICANSYQSARNAEEAGAHSIELCSELALGGITPSYGLLKKVCEEIRIPIHVLIRPRSGDFTYTDDEFEIMKENILLCKKLGASRIVSGVLLKNNTIDIARTAQLVALAKPMQFTFHRAFDWVKNPETALHALERIGVDTILSSGQEISAVKGLLRLLAWQQRTTKITLLPGGGINVSNISLFQKNGFKGVHLSATSFQKTIEEPKISMQSLSHFEETKQAVTDFKKVKKCLEIVSKKR